MNVLVNLNVANWLLYMKIFIHEFIITYKYV